MEYAQIYDVSTEWIASNLLNFVTALVVLAAGLFLSGFLARHSRQVLPKTRRIDDTVAPILSQVVRYATLAVTAVIVLSQFGVQTASILAIFGAVGLAVALALQGTLSNLAAGILLIWLRPFNVGEYIDGEGVAGTIVEVGLFGTRLRTYDGIAVFAPNSKLWNAKIVNFTREPSRMVETRVGVSYGSDLARVREAMLSVTKDERVLAEPAPLVVVTALGASSVDVLMRSWVKSSDWWRANVDFLERSKLALDAAGIEIPFNQLDVKLTRTPPGRAA